MTRMLSTGHEATLAGYRTLVLSTFGRDSRAIAYLDEKIAQQGANEPVLADEGQMVHLLATIHLRGAQHEESGS